jgi:hypothetical protein
MDLLLRRGELEANVNMGGTPMLRHGLSNEPYPFKVRDADISDFAAPFDLAWS